MFAQEMFASRFAPHNPYIQLLELEVESPHAIKPVCLPLRRLSSRGRSVCWEALETPQVMPRVLLYMLEVRVYKLEAVAGGFGLLEVL